MSNSLLRAAFAAITCAGAIATFAISAHAYSWANCSQYASWNQGTYTLDTDEWGASSGQCVYANSATNWWAVCNYSSGNNVKTYPHTAVYPYIGYSGSMWAWFSSSTGSGTYDNSFDIWTNDGSEIMIWENWNGGATPAGSIRYYNQSGCGNGGTWNVWQGNVGHNCVSFQREGQWWSGTEYITSVVNWAHSHGLIGGSQIKEVDFGFEVFHTNGSQTWTLNGYSAGW